MTKLNTVDLALTRKQPQQTKVYMSIYKPECVFACLLSGAFAGSEQRLSYDTVSSGSYSKVNPGMTAWVGTTWADTDVAKIRIKAITGSYVEVAANSYSWKDNAHFLAMNFYEIWPVHTRLVTVPEEEDFEIYKDYDIAYSNQNTINGSMICMGSHYAGFLDNGQAQVWYSSSGTVNVNGDTMSYLWDFGGGIPTGSTAADPGYVAYSNPGHFTTMLRVTSSSGKVDKAYRHVSIYNPPKRGNVQPIMNWGMEELSGSRDEGGHYASMWVREILPENVDGSLVVLFTEDYYGITKKSLGGNSENRSSILFVGYIMDGSVTRDWKSSKTMFEVFSPTGIMKARENSAVSIESVSSPTDWREMQTMTLRKAFYHYFAWHSTINMCSDIQLVGDNKTIQFFDTEKANLYDALYDFLDQKLKGEMVSDRQGKIWIEYSAGITPNATGTFTESMSINKPDWMGNLDVEEIIAPTVSRLEIGGINYSGPATGSSLLYLTTAPGEYPDYFGSEESYPGMYVNSQEELDRMAGTQYLYLNSRYPSVGIDFVGSYRNLDIAPQEILSITVSPDDTYQKLSWNAKPFVIRDMSLSYDPTEWVLMASAELHEVPTSFITGVAIPVPPIEQENWQPYPNLNPDIPNFPMPSINFPRTIPAIDLEDSIGLECADDLNAHPNGPYSLGGATLYSNQDDHPFWFRRVIRTASAAYKTSWLLAGYFEDNSDSGWIPSTTDTWWDFVATDSGEATLLSATKDSPMGATTKTGKFLPPAAMEAFYLKLVMAKDSLAVAAAPFSVSDSSVTVLNSGTFAWEYDGPQVLVNWTGIIFRTGSSDNTVFIPRFILQLAGSGNPEYNKTIEVDAWGSISQPSYLKSDDGWSVRDCLLCSQSYYPGLSGISFSHKNTYNLTDGFALGYASHWKHGSGVPPFYSTYDTTMNLHWRIALQPTHRIRLNNITLWNICPRPSLHNEL